MRLISISLFLSLCLLSVVGCATNQITVTYYSDPAGATLYQENILGYTPITRAYNLRPSVQRDRYIKLPPTKVVWASGVFSEANDITVDRNEGSEFSFTFVRPNVQGREIDANFALQLQRNRILQQQAQAERDQALWQLYNTMLNQQRQSYTPTFKSYDCETRQIGNTIYTNCR